MFTLPLHTFKTCIFLPKHVTSQMLIIFKNFTSKILIFQIFMIKFNVFGKAMFSFFFLDALKIKNGNIKARYNGYFN